jgi:Protein of unknown function (DUF3667)
MTCKNCALEFDSNYCPDCGQKATTKRFSTRILFSEFIDKILPLDRGVLFTSWQLIKQPGVMMRGYLAGKRVGYTKPLQYLLIISAITLFFFSTEDFKKGMSEGFSGGYSASGAQKDAKLIAFQESITNFISGHISLLMIGMLPFLALVSRWFFRKQNINYAEHFVMNCYYLAACSIISMPFLAMMKLWENNMFSSYSTVLFTLFYLGYYIWTYTQFFQNQKWWVSTLKAIFVFLTGYLLYILFLGIACVIAMIVVMVNG